MLLQPNHSWGWQNQGVGYSPSYSLLTHLAREPRSQVNRKWCWCVCVFSVLLSELLQADFTMELFFLSFKIKQRIPLRLKLFYWGKYFSVSLSFISIVVNADKLFKSIIKHQIITLCSILWAWEMTQPFWRASFQTRN